jgi:hypothetical protein
MSAILPHLKAATHAKSSDPAVILDIPDEVLEPIKQLCKQDEFYSE